VFYLVLQTILITSISFQWIQYIPLTHLVVPHK
jgi:hypothetical protein